MAEGGTSGAGGGAASSGDHPDDLNPYSFQKFIKKQTSEEEESRRTNRTRNAEPVAQRSARREENPFSFKQFLNKDTPNKPKVYSLMVDDISETCGGSRARTLTPDLATDLPDFVQDHFIPADSNSESRIHKNNPNSDSRGSNPRSSLATDSHNGSNNQPNHSYLDLTSEDGLHQNNDLLNNRNVSDEDDTIECSNTNNQDSGLLSLSLPDFLSDGPMLNHVPTLDENSTAEAATSQIKCPYCQATQSDKEGDDETQSAELRRINADLLHQLDSSRALAESATRKVLKLEKEVSVLQSKEVAETAALEQMVRQVEQNLQLTTQRAVKAENTVAKLKQEVKTLQNQLVMLSSKNDSLKLGGNVGAVPEEIRAKANNISTMLSSAAKEAETSLTQLMRGVEHLRFLSTVAKNIDKVTDSTPTAEPQ